MNKYQIRQEKIKQKEIKRTLRKARVPKDATPEEVNSKLISYVAGLKIDFYTLRFTDEQLADPDFLLGLYRANINMVDFQSPNPENEDLQSNINFMIEYIKLKHAKKMREHTDEKYWAQQELEWIVQHYKKAMSNPAFVERLAQEFIDIKIVPLVKNSVKRVESYFNTEKEQEDEESFRKCILGLPTELLCRQARRYGSVYLNDIPKDIPNFNQIVSAGIENDGFKSLCKLDITQVLDNKDLIIKAYQKDGIRALEGYISCSLSPNRTLYYMCHGEEHSYTSYNERYANVQKALNEDAQIHYIFKKEQEIEKARIEAQKKKEAQSTFINEDNMLNR